MNKLIFFTAALAVSAASAAETLRAFQSASTVDVWVGGRFFTSYRYNTGEKLPYFFPVNGPSGASVTSVRNPQYPHHASLWFGCDRVNGGNYWQDKMESGRILSESLVKARRGWRSTADARAALRRASRFSSIRGTPGIPLPGSHATTDFSPPHADVLAAGRCVHQD